MATKEKTAKNNEENLVIGKDEYDMAKAVAAKGATEAEFKLLVHIANKYHLDPLLKEIWFIKRNPNENPLIMTSRDGYLAIAHRSGQFDGMQSGTVEDQEGNLMKAWAEVWRKDMSHSFRSEVKFNEYRQNSFIWQKYPSAMLIKVAEVFALKRAFSISGMVTQEEVGNENIEPPVNPNLFIDGGEEKELKKLKKQILDLGKKLGLDELKTKETVEIKYDLHDFEELSCDQAKDAVRSLEDKISHKEHAKEPQNAAA